MCTQMIRIRTPMSLSVRSRDFVYVCGWKYVRKQGMSNGWQCSVIMLSSSARFICSRRKNVAYSPPQNSYLRCAMLLVRRNISSWHRRLHRLTSLTEIRWNSRIHVRISEFNPPLYEITERIIYIAKMRNINIIYENVREALNVIDPMTNERKTLNRKWGTLRHFSVS